MFKITHFTSKLRNMNYIEVAVTVEPKQEGSDVLIATLSEFAYEIFTETETGSNSYIKEEEYREEEVALALGDFDDIYKKLQIYFNGKMFFTFNRNNPY